MKAEIGIPLPKTSREIVLNYTRGAGLGVRLDG